ncbi:hypothetical protein KR51_00015760 [Rubidibacter lacunae KORDI 51-2]|uniref:Uncharacterized protein n=1 Tax=Rubidibacter lacunae KORDI 51-2 TaxID=582515 RepID=U5DPV1_9CHRO|nr:hypothetical protein [Rubidibacter lacunae]ERN41730.1 hypothetical protein KR51_00015760 [Rubidibacter lacunae KORDI 51-2]
MPYCACAIAPTSPTVSLRVACLDAQGLIGFGGIDAAVATLQFFGADDYPHGVAVEDTAGLDLTGLRLFDGRDRQGFGAAERGGVTG